VAVVGRHWSGGRSDRNWADLVVDWAVGVVITLGCGCIGLKVVHQFMGKATEFLLIWVTAITAVIVASIDSSLLLSAKQLAVPNCHMMVSCWDQNFYTNKQYQLTMPVQLL
jgi:hypothetical protein